MNVVVPLDEIIMSRQLHLKVLSQSQFFLLVLNELLGGSNMVVPARHMYISDENFRSYGRVPISAFANQVTDFRKCLEL